MLFSAEGLNDMWTFGLLVIGIIGSGLGLAFSLGYNLSKLTGLEKRQEEDRASAAKDRTEIKADLGKIFDRLDLMTANPPVHHCQQLQTIGQLQATQDTMRADMRDHSARMDRIQQEIRDKEQMKLLEGKE